MRINKLISSLALCLMLAVASFATSFEVRNHAMPGHATAIHSVDTPAFSVISTDFELVLAVYSAAEVDIGDRVPAAKLERAIAVTYGADYFPAVEYAYLSPWPFCRNDKDIQHATLVNGFRGLGGNHFARADV